MAIKLADAFINITADSRGLDRELGKARKGVTAFGSVMQGIFQGVGQAAFRSLTRGLGAVVGEIGKAAKAGSDLQESMSKTGVVFGESAKDMLAWSKTASTAFGQSQQQALEAAASFGNLFVSMGLGREEAAAMSRELTELASDIASINNLEPEVALEKLRAGLVGETEPLRTVGVLLNQAAVEAKAAELGFAGTNKELTESQKVLARYNIILDQTRLAQGDFARTADGAANQARIFTAQMADLRAELGTAFTPAFAAVLKGLNDLIRTVRPYGSNLIDSFVVGATQAINTRVIPMLMLLRRIFVRLLKPGSPPKLLPELTDWGRGAMEAYLEGWSQADLGVLEDLGRSLESVIRSFAGAGQIKETDLVSRVFGTRRQIVAAMDEFRRAGTVSRTTLDAIARAAGPAGTAVRGLVSTYVDLQKASQAAAQAQEELTRVTEDYDRKLAPLDTTLRAVQNQQQDIRDQQRAAQLNAEIADINTTAGNRQLAQLELQEIELRRQMRLLEDEKTVAVDAAQEKVDAAGKEQAARQDAYDAQQAIVNQQVEANRLIEEEAGLRQRLASEALAEQERALRELEAAQKELERADEQRKADLERLYQAQLDYNMQIADTPGKIALLKLELGRYKEGSAEYYGILTQIAALEQQLEAERTSGAGSGAAPPIDPIEDATGAIEGLKDEYIELGEAIEQAFAVLLGKDQDEWKPPSLLSDPTKGLGLYTVAPPPDSGLPKWIEMVVDSLGDLTKGITDFQTFLETTLDALGLKAETSSKEMTELQKNTQAQWMTYLRLFVAAYNGDWAAFWAANRRLGELAHEENRLVAERGYSGWLTTLGNFLTQLAEDFAEGIRGVGTEFTTWADGLYDAGYNAVKNLWSGIGDYWNTVVVPGWMAKTQWLRDLLPGSEPANPASPLRRLDQAGAAIVENMMAGMQNASATLSPTVASNLTAAAAGPIVNNYFAFDQVFSTAPDFGMARAASREGVLAALRTRGG